jgi:hypothetical protein
VFHEFAALCVEFGVDPFSFVGQTLDCEDGKARPFTQEMANKMLPGLDYIRSVEAGSGVECFVEVKVDLSEWFGPGMFGTSDVILVDVDNREIVVFDWKWGAGVAVEPEWNDQGMSYALGAWSTIAAPMFEGVEPAAIALTIVIEQPRAPGGGGVWKTNMATILAEGRAIRADADAAQTPGALRVPGADQCKFCAAAKHNTCRARSEFVLDLVGASFDSIDEEIEQGVNLGLRDRKAFTPEQRSHLLLNRKMIDSLLSDLHDDAMRDAENGLPTPGLKRVYGRSPPRSWTDESKVIPQLEAEFGEDAWNKKLRSPAMIEGEVGVRRYRERWQRHVTEGQPAPALVPETDPRPAIPSVDDIFDELAEEDLI